MIPLVSIIIPTYNRAYLIGETLDSILAQTYTNWECIVVDDGSTDDTYKVLQEYLQKDARFQFYERPTDRLKGPNSCRNFGFELSKGDLIKWFDSDDILLENALEKNIYEFDGYTDVVISRMEYVDFFRNKTSQEHIIYSENVIEDYLVGKITYYVSPPTWKRNFLLKQSELFDEKIRNLDDWDFNLRMLYSNPNIRYIDLPLIQYRLHSTSLSCEIGKVNIDEIKSAFYAREKHVKLLVSNNKADFRILKNYILLRYKMIVRKALLANSEHKYDLLLKLMGKEVRSLDFIGLINTVLGSVIYIFFKRGVKLLK